MKLFLIACSQAYDAEFAYRFMVRLRNYALHCGMLIGTIRTHAEINKRTEEIETRFQMLFRRDTLLEEFDGWSTLKSEIAALPEEFLVDSLVDGMMTALDGPLLALIRTDLPHIEEAVRFIRGLFAPFEGMVGDLAIAQFEEDRKPPFHVTMTRVPMKMLRAGEEILSKGKSNS